MPIDTLRKACCWLALLLSLASVIMMAQQKGFQNPKLPADMTNPGIAMELVRNADEIRGLANNDANRETLHRLQILDEALFIPAYLLFFSALSLLAFRSSPGWVRWFGLAILISVIVAAIFDYREDWGILSALANLQNPQADPISSASYKKWALLFAMLLFHIPVFLRRWPSATLRVLGLVFAFFVVMNAAPGLTACFFGGRGQIESAASSLAAPVVFFLCFVSLFHKNAMTGLNSVADFPGVKFILSWPDLKEPKKSA